MRRRLLGWSLLALSSLFARGLLAAPPRAQVVPTQATNELTAVVPTEAGNKLTVVSTEKDRKQVGITVYNQDFGLIREIRTLSSLSPGKLALEFSDVASTIQPETVHIRSLAGPDALSVLEQNYRYDLLTPEKLLEKYVGKALRVYRYHEARAAEEAIDARLLSVSGGPVLQVGSEVTFNYPGRFAFPALPDDLIARPTLVWLVESRAPKQEVEVSYLARGMNWNADYVVVLDERETRADLTGWVTLVNQTGTTYADAELKLVAGDVHRAAPAQRPGASYSMTDLASKRDQSFREEGLFEYHLYTLGRPTTLRHNEQKQVNLLEVKAVGVKKKLLFSAQNYWYRSQQGTVASNQKVAVHLELVNSEKNGLGMPLPRGTLRVYKADKSGAQQFVGEDAIDHTPRDEKLEVKLGEAFDVVGDRKQLKWTALGTCGGESSWQLELRNQKNEAVDIDTLEPAGGDWTIVSSSHPAERKDAQSFAFHLKVPARGKVQVNYVVRVRWC